MTAHARLFVSTDDCTRALIRADLCDRVCRSVALYVCSYLVSCDVVLSVDCCVYLCFFIPACVCVWLRVARYHSCSCAYVCLLVCIDKLLYITFCVGM
jgi:hypothetical protein